MKIYLVGNPLVRSDSLPLLLRPHLQKTFPQITFQEADANENFIPEPDSIIIDTVYGIKKVTWFDSVDDFITTKSVTPHDYDLGMHLKLLKKLRKLGKINILGIPKMTKLEQIIKKTAQLLEQYLF